MTAIATAPPAPDGSRDLLDSASGCDVLAVAVSAGAGENAPAPDALAVAAARRYGVDLAGVLTAERVRGRVGEVVRVPVQAPPGLPARLLLVGMGGGSVGELRRAGAALARAVRGRARLATGLAAGSGPAAVQAGVEGLLLGGYTPPATGVKDRGDAAPVGEVRLLGRYQAAALARGERHARATLQARDLTNTPSNQKDPAWMVARAEEAAAAGGLDLQVWDEHRLAAEGFGGLLAVGRGSVRPPRLVRLDYRPDGDRRDAGRTAGAASSGRAAAPRPDRAPVVLIGKGITFDTGGLSIKPRDAMVGMKTDMAGAAVVLAVLAACRDLGVRRPVSGLLALAENAVSGSSYRPGDVVRHYGGRTVEVVNTDAEGRMVLADALAYAQARLDPEAMVDVATLTGAASLGLGRRHAALYATDDRLAAALEAAALASGERVWRMPLEQDYRPALDSPVADLRHVAADAKLGGGSITAALFLREFTAGRRWAHLDIAGPARSDKDEHEVSRGGTGYAARLLLHWLEGLR